MGNGAQIPDHGQHESQQGNGKNGVRSLRCASFPYPILKTHGIESTHKLGLDLKQSIILHESLEDPVISRSGIKTSRTSGQAFFIHGTADGLKNRGGAD